MEQQMSSIQVTPNVLKYQPGLVGINIYFQTADLRWRRISKKAPIKKNKRKNKIEFRIDPVT